MVAKNRKTLRGNCTRGNMEDGRRQFAGNLVHIGDHQQQALAGGKGSRERAGGQCAVGGACRHAGRSIEDCYANNRRADKAAVFAGWREMNDYMRENNIQAMPPADAPAADEESVAETDKAQGS